MIDILTGMIISCIMTVAIECAVASIFLLNKTEYKYIIKINVLTNIILNIVYHIILLLSNNIINIFSIIIGEIIVTYIEAIYYSKNIKFRLNKYLFSLLLNSISFTTGIIIHIKI